MKTNQRFYLSPSTFPTYDAYETNNDNLVKRRRRSLRLSSNSSTKKKCVSENQESQEVDPQNRKSGPSAFEGNEKTNNHNENNDPCLETLSFIQQSTPDERIFNLNNQNNIQIIILGSELNELCQYLLPISDHFKVSCKIGNIEWLPVQSKEATAPTNDKDLRKTEPNRMDAIKEEKKDEGKDSYKEENNSNNDSQDEDDDYKEMIAKIKNENKPTKPTLSFKKDSWNVSKKMIFDSESESYAFRLYTNKENETSDLRMPKIVSTAFERIFSKFFNYSLSDKPEKGYSGWLDITNINGRRNRVSIKKIGHLWVSKAKNGTYAQFLRHSFVRFLESNPHDSEFYTKFDEEQYKICCHRLLEALKYLFSQFKMKNIDPSCYIPFSLSPYLAFTRYQKPTLDNNLPLTASLAKKTEAQ